MIHILKFYCPPEMTDSYTALDVSRLRFWYRFTLLL